MDVKVVQRDPSTNVLTLGISRPPQYVSGIDLVVQMVVIDLLSSPGRDIQYPQNGGNIRSLIGTNVAYDDLGEIFAEIRMMIKATERNIKNMQAIAQRPANEKLARLDLIDIIPDEQQLRLEIIVRVVTMDQQTTEAIVGLT